MKQITYCTPTKIILTDGNVRNAESLLKTKVTQIGLGENDLTLISGNARVVLDFGRETCGRYVYSPTISTAASPSEYASANP